MKTINSLVARRQDPLRPLYREDPSKALSYKEVRTLYTGGTDAVHGSVLPTGFPEVAWDYGIDDKVGAGDHCTFVAQASVKDKLWHT